MVLDLIFAWCLYFIAVPEASHLAAARLYHILDHHSLRLLRLGLVHALSDRPRSKIGILEAHAASWRFCSSTVTILFESVLLNLLVGLELLV